MLLLALDPPAVAPNLPEGTPPWVVALSSVLVVLVPAFLAWLKERREKGSAQADADVKDQLARFAIRQLGVQVAANPTLKAILKDTAIMEGVQHLLDPVVQEEKPAIVAAVKKAATVVLDRAKLDLEKTPPPVNAPAS